MKKRLPSVAVLSALLVALFAGAALAVNVINCTGSSTCQGTPQADDITGTDRPETIKGATPYRPSTAPTSW